MKTKDDIINLFLDRRKLFATFMTSRAYVRGIYNGDVDIPLPDMDRHEKPYVPNLLQTGLDQMAGRVASIVPQPIFAAKNSSRAQTRNAKTRSRVINGWWEADRLSLKMKYRARHLLAYAASPVHIRYDPKTSRPCWQVRDPFTAYPSPDFVPGQIVPTDIIYAYKHTLGWCRAQGWELGNILTPNAKNDSLVTLIEYCDTQQTALVIFADPTAETPAWGQVDPHRSVMVENMPNPIGMLTSTHPMRVSLTESGQFDGMVGSYMMQAKLMALEIIAVEKGIFPDTYLEGRAGESPRFISGPHDGRTGEINIVAGGSIRSLNEQPGYVTTGIVDRLERAQRITAGIPAEFGGESGTNIRTGRRGDAVLSAVIDFPVAEAQEVLAQALTEENKIAIALTKHFDGTATRTIYVGTGNNRTAVTYNPTTVFGDEVDHTVTYPVSGTDLNAFMIGIGQRVGLGTMSHRTAAELDPFIADAEAEHDATIVEGLEQALLSGLQQQAAAGNLPPAVLSKINMLVSTDRLELAEAVTKATEEYAAQQAATQAAQAAGGSGVPTADAAAAGAGVSALAGSPVPGASPGQTDLASLLSTLRSPQNSLQGAR